MADYVVTGKKGSGKSLACVGRIRDALLAGKKVATNLDIRLDELLPANSKATLIRLPDAPTIDDLELIGRGQEGMEEENNGVIVIDECAAFLNARAWGDKDRQPMLNWFIHSRKLGWDTYFIAQAIDQIDKQIRSALVEFHVVVKRTDRLPIPFISALTVMVGWKLTLPKIHVASVKYGCDFHAPVVDRWIYRAKELYRGYDTNQRFKSPSDPTAVGIHSMLSAYHLKGRYQPSTVPLYARLAAIAPHLIPHIHKLPLYALTKAFLALGLLQPRHVPSLYRSGSSTAAGAQA